MTASKGVRAMTRRSLAESSGMRGRREDEARAAFDLG